MSYHYLVASVPELVLDEDVPFSPRDFFSSCSYMLSRKDRQDLHHVLKGHTEHCRNPLAREYVSRDTQLRCAVARIRASRLKVESQPFVSGREFSGYDVSIETGVAHAMAQENPLDRELGLNLIRWRIIDHLLLSDPFGSFAVLGFFIKLTIAYRWSQLKDDIGRERLEEIVEKNLQEGIT